MQNMYMCANTLSKTQHAEQVKCTETPWNSYVKIMPAEEFVIGHE